MNLPDCFECLAVTVIGAKGVPNVAGLRMQALLFAFLRFDRALEMLGHSRRGRISAR
jgi:hypothetical protein